MCAQAQARAHVWKYGATLTFPFGVHELLADARADGASFEEAWLALDLDRRARDAGFGRERQNPFSVESVLIFTKRHLRAAYERVPTLSYCEEEDCPYLALFDGHCALHVDEERIAS